MPTRRYHHCFSETVFAVACLHARDVVSAATVRYYRLVAGEGSGVPGSGGWLELVGTSEDGGTAEGKAGPGDGASAPMGRHPRIALTSASVIAKVLSYPSRRPLSASWRVCVCGAHRWRAWSSYIVRPHSW